MFYAVPWTIINRLSPLKSHLVFSHILCDGQEELFVTHRALLLCSQIYYHNFFPAQIFSQLFSPFVCRDFFSYISFCVYTAWTLSFFLSLPSFLGSLQQTDCPIFSSYSLSLSLSFLSLQSEQKDTAQRGRKRQNLFYRGMFYVTRSRGEKCSHLPAGNSFHDSTTAV